MQLQCIAKNNTSCDNLTLAGVVCCLIIGLHSVLLYLVSTPFVVTILSVVIRVLVDEDSLTLSRTF